MAPEKKARNGVINQWFKPIRPSATSDEPVNMPESNKYQDTVDLTTTSNTIIDIVSNSCANEDTDLLILSETFPGKAPEDHKPELKRHSFFCSFEGRLERSKQPRTSTKSENGIAGNCKNRAAAPLFPTFIGTDRSIRRKIEAELIGLPHRIAGRFNLGDHCTGEVPLSHGQPLSLASLDLSQPERSFKAIDEIFGQIMESIRTCKGILQDDGHGIIDEEDEDDWLPKGFRDISNRPEKPADSGRRRHLYLVCGRSGIGKSHIASRLAKELNVELVEVGTVGRGPKGERTPKELEDCIISAAHRKLQFQEPTSFSSDYLFALKGGGGSGRRVKVVLIDEIDLVFNGHDNAFIGGLSSYLARASSSQIVVMTSNAKPTILSRFYDFPDDLQRFEVPDPNADEPHESALFADLFAVEGASFWDCLLPASDFGPDCRKELTMHTTFDVPDRRTALDFISDHPIEYTHPTLYSAWVRRAFLIYSQRASAGHKGNVMPPPVRLSEWACWHLPVWSHLERLHAEAEEERQLACRSSRRRQNAVTNQMLYGYLRGGIDADVTLSVRNHAFPYHHDI